ncbi:hypothetical protein H5410_014805 [Solanum commersonii]|uniref:Uncharacterized protein n=1 Tax=Solanum commersonii TaxID=4109 RepID=A0A9J5ZRW3_SOLCO|nr:hypothetical protein H5410_014805 [Solanum commersonii]
MTDKDEFNVAANIMIPIENPEEKMAHMQQELEIFREELCQATTFPTFKMPINFPKDDLPTNLPNQPEQTQHAPAHEVTWGISRRSYEPHVPPVYATGAPTFLMPAVVNIPYEKDAWLEEDASINSQLHGLRKELKSLQVTKGTKSLNYDDMCIHPYNNVPVGYKSPKYDMYDGKGDPHAHLRVYCDKLVGVGRNEKLRMMLLIQSLFGEALTWYTHQDPRKWRDWQEMDDDFMNHFKFNTQIIAKRFSLNNI